MKRLIFIATTLLFIGIKTTFAQVPDVSYSNEKTYKEVISYGLKPVQNNKGRWGYRLSNDDKIIIKPHFEQANSFYGTKEFKVASVLYNGKWGVIDWQGNYVVNPAYTEEPIIELCARYGSASPQFDILIALENRLVAYMGEKQVFNEQGIVEKNGAYFLIRKNYLEEIDRNTQVTLLKPKYGEIKKFDFCEKMDKRGVAVVSVEGRWGIAYKNYENIEYVSEDIEMIYNREDDKAPSIFKLYTIITKSGGKTTGGLYIDNKGVPHDLGIYSGCKEINIGGTKGFILTTGAYNRNLYRKPGPYTGTFLIDDNGKALITDVDDIYVAKIINGKQALRVKRGNLTAFYNINGKEIIPFTAGEIKFHKIDENTNLVGVEVIKREGPLNDYVSRFGIVSLDGEEIVSISCDRLPQKGQWVKNSNGYVLFNGQKAERIIRSRKNERRAFSSSFGYDVSRDEETMQDGNIYTYKVWGNNGFVYRECSALDKFEVIICHSDIYSGNKYRNATYLSLSEFTGDKNPIYHDLELVGKCNIDENRTFVVYDYRSNKGIHKTVSYWDVVDVVPNPVTGVPEMVYGVKDIYSRVVDSKRYAAIINSSGVEKRFSIPFTFNKFSQKKGGDIYLFGEQNVLCMNSDGEVNLQYSGTQGTYIEDVVRTKDGRYVLVGTTKVHGYIDYANLYVVILDKYGKKITEHFKAYRGVNVANIELSDREDEFIIKTSYGDMLLIMVVNEDNSLTW
jgi:hypothetical protein